MFNDPTDETHRKARQLRNTPLQKYVRLTSLVITLCYAGAMYISWRRHCCDSEVLKEFQASQLSEDHQSMLQDYATIPYLRGIIEKLFDRERAKLIEEVEAKDTPANV